MSQGAGEAPLILLVEDEPFIGYEVESTLIDAGFRVHGPLRSLKDAHAAATLPDIAVAVIDMLLTDGASDPVIETLLADNVPVIVTSGLNAQPALVDRCAGWLVKPYEPERLLDLVRKLVPTP